MWSSYGELSGESEGTFEAFGHKKTAELVAVFLVVVCEVKSAMKLRELLFWSSDKHWRRLGDLE